MTTAAEPAWEELHANLRAFIGRRVRNQTDVEDLVQRVLLQIVKGFPSLRDTERLHAWMYRTARNVIVDHYRSAGLKRELASGGAIELDDTPLTSRAVVVDVADEDEDAALTELATCMAPMLARLSPEHREAIVLTELNGLNQADAARRSGVSLSGMKSRIQRGRRQLRAALENCCRIELDRRGGIVGYERRAPDACDPNVPACASGPCDSERAPVGSTRTRIV